MSTSLFFVSPEHSGHPGRGARAGHQDGGGHRGLPAHRVRVRQAEVPLAGNALSLLIVKEQYA